MLGRLYGAIYFLLFSVVFYVFKQLPSCFSCLAACFNAVLLWSSRNVLRTMRLCPTFHRNESEQIIPPFSFNNVYARLCIWYRLAVNHCKLNSKRHGKA